MLVCFFDPTGIATIYENIALWQKFSRYGIEVLNLWPTRADFLTIPSTVDLDDYAGLIVHCTTSYHPDNLYSLDRGLGRPFEQYDGVKILMKQDEHWHTSRFSTFIGEKKFDLVITCVSPEERGKVYPPDVVGNVEFVQAFTGYVSPFMLSLAFGGIVDRPFHITYRGSIQPLSFGRLGFEKRKIGYDVAHAARGYPLNVNISSNREDRIGGTAWFDFLGSSKAVLGVESGTNLFDFDGQVEGWCREFENSHSGTDQLGEEFYNEAHRIYLHKFEGNVNYAQISPRHLEAAATRSAQILYEGYYSGIFFSHRHYFPLKRDLTNFEEVVDFVADQKQLSEMADRTFEEIILNRKYHYETFVEQVDAAVDRVFARKGRRAAAGHVAVPAPGGRRALLLAGHEPTMDPRVDWMAEGLSNDFEVCELGTCDGDDGASPSCERLSERRTRLRVGRQHHDCDLIPDIAGLASGNSIALQHLMLLYVLAELPAKALGRAVGALDATEEDLFRFRWATRHFLHTNSALLQAGRLIGEFDAIVATDLNTLPAALALAEENGATVLYDAHEFWPYAFMEYRHWEIEFWSVFERNLAPRADLRVTVSPQLAALMSKEYGCNFLTVPNCAIDDSVHPVDIDRAIDRLLARDKVDFIFLGGFVAGRGLEDLITAWHHVDKRARLLLQGPDGPFKTEMIELARSRELLGDRIFFPPAVETSELVRAARQADIGIIPYAASSLNNRYCSPNKLSQYMAAGVPIICNSELEFVKSVVVENKIGLAVDFHDHDTLARVLNDLVASKNQILEMSRRSYRCFEENFNWKTVSRDMYAKLGAAVRIRAISARTDLDFSWIKHGREMRPKLTEKLDDAVPLFAGAEIKRLTQEVDYLRSEFASETSRLINEVEFVRSELASETARLAREVNRLQAASIGQLLLLCIRARVIIAIKSLPTPMLLPLRYIRTNFRRRFRGAQSQ